MKLNYKRTILIGMAFMTISAFWQLYDNIVPLILKEHFSLPDDVTGVIMAADNVFALFLLPIFGAFSDKTNTKIGKRMPYILIGTGLSAVFLMILSMADQKQNLIMFIGVLFILLLSMGLYRSPAVALMPDLTPKPLRSKGNAVINLLGAVGGVFTLGMTKLLVQEGKKGEPENYFYLFLAVAIFMVVGVLVLFLTIKENKLRKMVRTDNEEPKEKVTPKKVEPLPKPVKKSLIFLLLSVAFWFIAYNAVISAFSRYATVVWGLKKGDFADCLMIAMIAAIISYLPIGFIAGKIGRKKTILLGIALLGFGFFCAGFYSKFHISMVVFFVIIGFAWAAIGVNSYPMVVEMSKAGDVGKYTGYYYTFSMAAQVITPILSGVLLRRVSYRTLFPYSVVFCALAFITMLMVRHGDTKPVPKKSVLENFDVDD